MAENLVLALFVVLPGLSGWALQAFARRGRKFKTPASWQQLLAGNALVLAFLFSLLLLGGEVYYRFVYDTTDALSFTKVSKRWFQRYWHENALLTRDDASFSLKLTGARRRVTFIGDSFTAGHGIKDVEHRFVNIIRRAHPDWEVHMLARPGWDTGSELDNLRQGVRHGYQMDQVVLVYCLNDVADMMTEWTEFDARIRAEAAKAGWLRRNSYFLDTVYARLQARRNPFLKSYYGFVISGYRGPFWQQQQRRLKEFRDLVQSNGGRLAVVTFPFLHALGPHYEFQLAHDKLDQLWRELSVPHLDLLPVYKDLPSQELTVNRFDAHPNEYANALAATAIDQFLTQQFQRASIPTGN